MTKRFFSIILLLGLSWLLLGCDVTLEQGQQLEKAGKIPEATRLYWEIVKSETSTTDQRKLAKEAVIRLKDPIIVPDISIKLADKSPIIRRLSIEIAAAYNDKVLYSSMINSLFYVNESLDNLTYTQETLISMNNDNMIPALINALDARITMNITTKNQLAFSALFDILGESHNKQSTDKLLGLLDGTHLTFESSVIHALAFTGDVRMVKPLLLFGQQTSTTNRESITEIFMQFNDESTYAFIIETAGYSPLLQPAVLDYLRGKLNVTYTNMFEGLLKKTEYQLTNPVTLFVIDLIHIYSDIRVIDSLVQLLDLKSYSKDTSIDSTIQKICTIISDLGNNTKLYRMFGVIGQSLELSVLHNYYAYPTFYDTAIALAKKSKTTDKNIVNYFLSMKDLGHVYQLRQHIAVLAKEADAQESPIDLRKTVQKIVALSDDSQQYIPMAKILGNIRYYADNIADSKNQKEADNLLKLSGYTKNIKYERVLAPERNIVEDYIKSADLIKKADEVQAAATALESMTPTSSIPILIPAIATPETQAIPITIDQKPAIPSVSITEPPVIPIQEKEIQ